MRTKIILSLGILVLLSLFFSRFEPDSSFLVSSASAQDVLESLEQNITRLVESVKPSLVTIEAGIFPEGRGSTVGSNVLYGLARNGLAPKLIGTSKIESITISGAIFGGIPMVSSIDEAVFDEIRNGDILRANIQGSCAILEKLEKSKYFKKPQST